MPKRSNETKPRQFRLSGQVLRTMDALKVRLGLTTRTDVIRFAVTQLAEKVLGK